MDSPKNKTVNGVQIMCTYKAIGDHSGEDFCLQGLVQVFDLYGLIVENYSQETIINVDSEKRLFPTL